MSIMDMLQQAGGPGGVSPGPPGPPAPPEGAGSPPPGQASDGGDPSDLIREMLDILDEYKQTEEDEADLLLINKIGVQLQQLLANNQKELDDAMGGKISPKLLRKQYADTAAGSLG